MPLFNQLMCLFVVSGPAFRWEGAGVSPRTASSNPSRKTRQVWTASGPPYPWKQASTNSRSVLGHVTRTGGNVIVLHEKWIDDEPLFYVGAVTPCDILCMVEVINEA